VAIVESTKPDFGGRMKRLREERGVSLRQIADATKLSVGALEALERNHISRLPGGIFSRAFVRSYATQVGLDPEQTVRDFLVQFPHDSVTVGSPHAALDGDRMAAMRSRSGATFVAVLVTVTVIVGAILLMTLTN
jgi:cytoskeleton protein RodZ